MRCSSRARRRPSPEAGPPASRADFRLDCSLARDHSAARTWVSVRCAEHRRDRLLHHWPPGLGGGDSLRGHRRHQTAAGLPGLLASGYRRLLTRADAAHWRWLAARDLPGAAKGGTTLDRPRGRRLGRRDRGADRQQLRSAGDQYRVAVQFTHRRGTAVLHSRGKRRTAARRSLFRRLDLHRDDVQTPGGHRLARDHLRSPHLRVAIAMDEDDGRWIRPAAPKAWLALDRIPGALAGGGCLLLEDRTPARALRVECRKEFSLPWPGKRLALASFGSCARGKRCRRRTPDLAVRRKRELQEAGPNQIVPGAQSVADLDSGQPGGPVLWALLPSVRACPGPARGAIIGRALRAPPAASRPRACCALGGVVAAA